MVCACCDCYYISERAGAVRAYNLHGCILVSGIGLIKRADFAVTELTVRVKTPCPNGTVRLEGNGEVISACHHRLGIEAAVCLMLLARVDVHNKHHYNTLAVICAGSHDNSRAS